MKKNKMLRMASVMLVLTLLTTSIIGGTFAKYVTTDSAQDAARVAKFGVVATVAGDLFGSTYKAKADNNAIMSYDVNGGTVSADAEADKVVAPGTQNKEGLSLTVKGTPEVSTQVLAGDAKDADGNAYVNSDIYLAKGKYGVMVKYTGLLTNENIGNYYTKNADGNYVTATDATAADVYELRDVVDFTAGADYYPLTWYVNNGKVDNQTKVKEAITTTFNAQAGNPNQAYNLTATVGWEWEFSDVASGEISDKDLKDTILGKMIADKSGTEDVVYITADSVTTVVYKDEAAADGAVNNVVNAYAGEGGAKVACLTVAFNTSLTVEQVD